ncbi:helix-turn-helix transcriptional regulator [Corynebacterium confusum]|uniref:helix-turn-helix transcriptional regulator n=1 Tax=Corynebacterium confusum TaxID=71254 RepID=UPI0025B48B3A|nr:helix-turn-helix transcriptional regulator [Corynebacterium confusum]
MSFWKSCGELFASNLRTARVRRGLSQRALADISGVSRNQIGNLERARAADPTVSTVYKLALALEIPPAVLLPYTRQFAASLVAEISDVAAFSPAYVRQRRREATQPAFPGGAGKLRA